MVLKSKELKLKPGMRGKSKEKVMVGVELLNLYPKNMLKNKTAVLRVNGGVYARECSKKT